MKDIIKGIINKNEKNLNKDEFFVDIFLELFNKKYIVDKEKLKIILSKNKISFKENKFNIRLSEKDLNNLATLRPKDIILITEKFLCNREMTGSYYTPEYIVDFMIYDSLKNYISINTNMDAIKIINFVKKHDISEISHKEAKDLFFLLKRIKIIDIACGSGIFIISFFYKLFKLISILSIYLNYPFNGSNLKYEILKENIFGVDIQNIPLQVLKIALLMEFLNYKDFKLEEFKYNLIQENSILGDKIFKNKIINRVCNDGGFDIVIGNPPYIGEKGNKFIFQKIKEFEFGKKYYESKMDLFYYFIYRGIELLKSKGVLTYITTNYFITADGASKLREFLKNKTTFKTVVNLNEVSLFDDAKGQHNIIFTTVKGRNINQCTDVIYFNERAERKELNCALYFPELKPKLCSCYTMNHNELFGNNGNIVLYSHKSYKSIINKIEENSDYRLGDISKINQGLVSGADRVNKRIIDKKIKEEGMSFNIGEGIYVLKDYEVIEKDLKTCRYLKPFYKNSDIKKYFTKKKPNLFILYFDDNSIITNSNCPAIRHLLKFKSILSERREVVKGVRKWYALQWYRNSNIFEKYKIVVPHRSKINSFGYSEIPWYASADVYYITSEDKNTLKLILGMLNSKIIYFWLYNRGKRKGNYLELYSKPLSEIPIKLNIPEDIKEKIVSMVDKILIESEDEYNFKTVMFYQDKIDILLYKFYNFTKGEIKLIEDLYNRAFL